MSEAAWHGALLTLILGVFLQQPATHMIIDNSVIVSYFQMHYPASQLFED